MQGMGAEVIFHGDSFDAARLHCELLAREHGYRYIHSGDEPGVNRAIRVIGVQSEAAPAAYRSWRGRALVEVPSRTFAEGLSTGTAFALPQEILRAELDDFVLVGEDEIRQAMVWMIERAHTLAEGAGAAPLAAAYRLRGDLVGKKVGLICSGGNTSLEHLRQAMKSSEH
jgi:threonine dehydratase